MIRKSGNRFSDKIMLKQKDEIRIIGVRAAPGSGTGTAEPTWFSLPTKISKTTPCKVAWCRWHRCFERILRKHFDTSGKSAALLHHRAICKTPMALPDTWPCPTTGSLARLQAKNPYPQLKLHRLAEVASARHSEGSPLALPSRARLPCASPRRYRRGHSSRPQQGDGTGRNR